jgi:hypothetical protein
MKDFNLEDCRNKLMKLKDNDKISLLYQWVKTDVINLKQFKLLLTELIKNNDY